ncbi:DUF421 domain-containing protein [Metabacillus indicus]|uniref:DUF421 domain-containing protein n=1 Tax=Metabacillus indicus TaxID=246786 RepID=UPI003CE794E9
MSFFEGQDTLTAIQWSIRAVIAFFFLVLAAKVMGQRSISQLRLLDFVIALIIGNIVAHPLADQRTGMAGSMITMSVLIFLYFSSIFISLKFPVFRKMMNAAPISVIHEGTIHYGNLKKARLTLEDLLLELRKQQVEDPSKVAKALFESDGQISLFLKTEHQPVSNKALGIASEPFELPVTIIKEGILLEENLLLVSKNKEWLQTELQNVFQKNISDILLGTVTFSGKLKIFLYS